ncbi:polycomb group RING finger protein 3 [Eupeodes corollae]|uniref:polycomb group RING finger protein 3 n=1 Tax=Eupeodes corollae TaxID=290404 RepID=UPI00248F5D60|nr:polycomb group RING finger protein 3 [Eupeodes corollae]
MERRVKLKTINPHITCKICGGYFIDATTVTECLHTFCKSCLVKHLEEKKTCPTCENVIHQSHPLQYISFDRTMQDIVYKLVPNLQEDETRRERDFYKSRNMQCPKDQPQNHDDDNEKVNEAHAESDYHRQDEQVNVCLECMSNNFKDLQRRFIRCSSQATITHLKKLVAKKILNGIEKYREIDILCNEELLGKDHTLKFVYVTRWRFREPPLRLQFRPRVDL